MALDPPYSKRTGSSVSLNGADIGDTLVANGSGAGYLLSKWRRPSEQFCVYRAVAYNQAVQTGIPEPQFVLVLGFAGAIMASARRLRSKLG